MLSEWEAVQKRISCRSFEERFIEAEKLQKLKEYLKDTLTPREMTVIRLRYGLGGRKELPQREVAKKLKISRSYVSRIEKKALQTLRIFLDDKQGEMQ